MIWFLPRFRRRPRIAPAAVTQPRVTLQPGMRVQLSETCPIKAEQQHLPTALRLMAYDELTGWFETLDPEHCLSRAPLESSDD